MNTTKPANALSRDATVIGLVSLAHAASHFSQLLLPPLFPWLKQEFNVGYADLGLLVSIFFIVSCVVQALSGFVVDKVGPRSVMFGGLGLLAVATLGMAISRDYWAVAFFCAVAGVGNGVFHPVDYTLLNRLVQPSRLGHAFSSHGVSGNLGWAFAPAMLVPLALAFSWRVALGSAALVFVAALVALWIKRDELDLDHLKTEASESAAASTEPTFGFLTVPSVWMCFAFFFFHAVSLSGVQAFAPEAARIMHDVSSNVAAMCVTIYMIGSATGMVAGGFLASDRARCERVIGIGFGIAASIGLIMALADVPAALVPVMFGVMGLCAGLGGPSRDLLVKSSTPDNATGRVYGVVYSGLDIGQAMAPLVFGHMMDLHMPAMVWVGIAAAWAVMITSAFNVKRVRRTTTASANAAAAAAA